MFKEKDDRKYRVWWIINVPGTPVYHDVANPEEGWKIIKEEVKRQLSGPAFISNVLGLDVFEYGEWSDWYDEEGNDVFQHFDKTGEYS